MQDADIDQAESALTNIKTNLSHMKHFYLLLCWTVFTCGVFAQKPCSLDNLPSKTLSRLNARFISMSGDIQGRSCALLVRMQNAEARLKERVARQDSTKAAVMFGNSQATYSNLQDKLQSTASKSYSLNEYIPNVDSMANALHFLQLSPSFLSQDKLQQIAVLNTSFQLLQSKLQAANEIQSFAQMRTAQLTAQLNNLNPGNCLQNINQQVFHYQQQITQLKIF